jgi:hypothetical protein
LSISVATRRVSYLGLSPSFVQDALTFPTV